MRSQVIAIAVVMAALAGVSAQDKPKPETRSSALTTLRVQVVLSRYDGDKKISSMPYTLMVIAGGGRDTRLGMGVQVPLQTIANNTVTIAYKDVGTDIICRVNEPSENRFEFMLTIQQSALYVAETGAKGTSERVSIGGNPILRSFDSFFTFLLRDGETKQLATATDPVNGNILKVDVTANVMK